MDFPSSSSGPLTCNMVFLLFVSFFFKTICKVFVIFNNKASIIEHIWQKQIKLCVSCRGSPFISYDRVGWCSVYQVALISRLYSVRLIQNLCSRIRSYSLKKYVSCLMWEKNNKDSIMKNILLSDNLTEEKFQLSCKINIQMALKWHLSNIVNYFYWEWLKILLVNAKVWIPDFGVSTVILNTIDFSGRWCKLHFGPLPGQVKSHYFPERRDAKRHYFYFLYKFLE